MNKHLTSHFKRPFYWGLALSGTLVWLAIAAVGCAKRTAELTVRVMDVDGNEIPGAMVALTQAGQTLLSDEKGWVTWTELTGDEASLVVVAEGYILRSKTIPLEPGANDMVIALEKRDVPIQIVEP